MIKRFLGIATITVITGTWIVGAIEEILDQRRDKKMSKLDCKLKYSYQGNKAGYIKEK